MAQLPPQNFAKSKNFARQQIGAYAQAVTRLLVLIIIVAGRMCVESREEEEMDFWTEMSF